MPTYDYRCTNCGDIFEHFQSMTDKPLMKCKKCGGELKRLIGAGSAPIFKGSGFYQTDYKNGSTSASNSSPSKSVNGSKSANSKPADTKIEKSSEVKKNPA